MQPDRFTRWPAQRVYYLREAWAALNSGLIVTSVWVMYYEVIQLSLMQIATIYAVITIAGIILEVPTGVIADTYSRRFSVILGGVFIGLCYTGIGLFPLFVVALLTALLEAFGDACVSGALDAWITDEVGADSVGPLFVRAAQLSAPMYWLGTALSIALAAHYSYQVPIVIGGLLWFVLTAVLLVTMPETGFQRRSPEQHGLGHLRSTGATFRTGLSMLRQHRVVLQLCMASFCISGLVEFFWRASAQQFLREFVLPVITLPLLGPLKDNAWLGFLAVSRSALVVGGMSVLQRTMQHRNPRTLAGLMTILTLLLVPAVLVFASTGSIWIAIVAWLTLNLAYDMAQPVLATWLNQSIESSARATILSIHSQVVMLGMLVPGSLLSLLGDWYGGRFTLLVGSLLLLPTLLLYGNRWFKERIVTMTQ